VLYYGDIMGKNDDLWVIGVRGKRSSMVFLLEFIVDKGYRSYKS
jgi:hypothetical protein